MHENSDQINQPVKWESVYNNTIYSRLLLLIIFSYIINNISYYDNDATFKVHIVWNLSVTWANQRVMYVTGMPMIKYNNDLNNINWYNNDNGNVCDVVK